MPNSMPPAPKGVDPETFRRAWASLFKADQQVLLISARNGFKPTVETKRASPSFANRKPPAKLSPKSFGNRSGHPDVVGDPTQD